MLPFFRRNHTIKTQNATRTANSLNVRSVFRHSFGRSLCTWGGNYVGYFGYSSRLKNAQIIVRTFFRIWSPTDIYTFRASYVHEGVQFPPPYPFFTKIVIFPHDGPRVDQ
ncbi:hypothetical protein K402DRAFT_173208 [Aulographum hederae CBS 113979]|uniref:Uncharacterized protein n=1 Tax=Aulographum hederae CBS 113979 TaxID=1176131 RepID=A0A6G1HDC0_9PEZI|nr:hypothetical protein K402DRAFT_173208 [Aulographum hederae CBS 113979]